MTLRLESLNSRERLENLRHEWENLHRDPTLGWPFLSPDWFLNCLDCFGEGKTWNVLAVRDNEELVAVAPFWIERSSKRGTAVRELGIIRAPDTPFVEIPALPKTRSAAIEQIAGHLHDGLGGSWDIARFGPIPERSPTLVELGSVLGRLRRRFICRPSMRLPYLPIEGDWDGYLKSRSAKFRKTARNIANRVEKLGDVEIEMYRNEANGRLLEELGRVARSSWKQEKGVALSSDDATVRFFRNLTASAARDACLMAWVLKAGDVPIATEYGLEHEKIVFALRADFDERCRESSPGTFLQLRILEYLFDNGYHAYNTGPGVNPYKLRTADRQMICKEIVLYNRTLRGMVIWAIEEKALPAARRLSRAIPERFSAAPVERTANMVPGRLPG